MKLPTFLVIGGMKCGSTTLYHDLDQMPSLYLAEKEANFFSQESKIGTDSIARYERLFHRARQEQICGDVSTTYAMLPKYSGVSERAADILGRETKIIYVVREPVSRVISHHYHMHVWHGEGKLGSDINKCVAEESTLIDFSRYAYQLEPWRKVFGDKNIKVVIFEEYVRDRQSTLRDICSFLGISDEAKTTDLNRAHNASDGKPVLNEFWRGIQTSRIYRQLVRSRLSQPLRTRLQRMLLPSAPARPAAPNYETVEKILEATANDVRELSSFMHRRDLIWNADEIRRMHTDSRGAAAA